MSEAPEPRSSAWRAPQVVGRPLVSASFAMTLGVLAGPPSHPWAATLSLLLFAPFTVLLAKRRRIPSALLLPITFFLLGLVVASARLPPEATFLDRTRASESTTNDSRILREEARGERSILLEGILRESVDLGAGQTEWLVDVTATTTAPGAPFRRNAGRARVSVDEQRTSGCPGARIRLLARVADPTNPSRRPRAARQGATSAVQLSAKDACTVIEETENDLLLASFRDSIARSWTCASPCPHEARQRCLLRPVLEGGSGDGDRAPLRPMLRAFATGDAAGVDPSTRRAFAEAGMPHLFAMTGLYVAMILLGAFLLLRHALARLPSVANGIGARRLAAILVVPLLVFLLWAQGDGGPSSLRIGVVLALLLLPAMLGRVLDPWSVLALAVLITTLQDPTSLGDARFQLAFAAVSTPFRLYPSLVSLFPRLEEPEGRLKWAVRLALGSVAVTLGTLPLVLRHFGGVSLPGLAGALIALPLVGIVVAPLTLLGAVLHASSDAAAAIPFGIAELGAALLMALVRVTSTLRAGFLVLARPTIGECILYYVASTLLSIPARSRPTKGNRRLEIPRGLGLVCLALLLASYIFHAVTGSR